jgi:predicted small metal-binding protein
MGRVLKCDDVHLGCKFEIRGETEDEILRQHAEHAKKEHRLREIRPEDWESARKAIREDEGRKVAGGSETSRPGAGSESRSDRLGDC